MAIDYPNSVDIQEINDEIWFDIINRTIILKDGYSQQDMLVQNDANSRNLGFMIQRYFESEDLSTKRIRIHYVNSLNQHDIASAHSIEVVGDEEDVISFQWLISDKVCAEGGNIQFAIEFYNNTETYRLFTKPITIGVEKGICTVGEFIEPESDWFKEYSSRMNVLESRMDEIDEAINNGEFDGAYALNTFSNALRGNASGEAIRIEDASPVEHTMDVKVKSKNLIKYPYLETTLTRRGLTYTDNGDGSISVEGTVTEAYSAFDLTRSLQLDDGVTYCMGGADSLYFGYSDETGTIKYYHGNASFTWSKNYTPIRLYLQYKQGDVVDEVVRPMLLVGQTLPEYIPYVDPTTTTLTRCGKNFWRNKDITFPKTFNGVTVDYDPNTQIYTFNGTSTAQIDVYTVPNGTDIMHINAGETWTLRLEVVSGTIDNEQITFDKISPLINTTIYTNAMHANTKLAYFTKTYTESADIQKMYFYIYASGIVFNNFKCRVQFELSDKPTEFEKFKESQTYTPNADGTVSGVTSLSPTTTLLTDTENVVIECEYNKDTNKVIAELLERTAPTSRISTATLRASAWTGSDNLYSQVVSIDGVTKNSQVDLTPSVEQLAVFYNKDLTFVTENENGVVTVYAIGQKPQNDYTIQVTLTEVKR